MCCAFLLGRDKMISLIFGSLCVHFVSIVTKNRKVQSSKWMLCVISKWWWVHFCCFIHINKGRQLQKTSLEVLNTFLRYCSLCRNFFRIIFAVINYFIKPLPIIFGLSGIIKCTFNKNLTLHKIGRLPSVPWFGYTRVLKYK